METKMYFLGTRKSDKCKNRAWAGWLDIENEIVREERFNLDSDRQDGLFWDRCGLKSMMRYRVDYSWKKQGDGKFFAIDVGDELYTDDLDDVLDKMPDLKNKNILGKFDCWKKRDLDREAKRNERKAAKRKKSDASCDDEDDRPFTKEELHRMNKRMESIEDILSDNEDCEDDDDDDDCIDANFRDVPEESDTTVVENEIDDRKRFENYIQKAKDFGRMMAKRKEELEDASIVGRRSA